MSAAPQTETEVWVADSSPLILLAKIGLLSLVPEMTARLVIPRDVLDEINDAPPDDPARRAVGGLVRAAVALVVAPVIPPTMTSQRLGRGETAALAEARNRTGSGEGVAVLLDDHDARREAKSLGLPVIGTVGILIRARDQGRIPALRPYLHRLQDAGMWGSEAFYRQAASSVGETWP